MSERREEIELTNEDEAILDEVWDREAERKPRPPEGPVAPRAGRETEPPPPPKKYLR